MPYFEGRDQDGRIVTITQRSTVGEATSDLGGAIGLMGEMVGLDTRMDKFLNLLLFIESEVITISLLMMTTTSKTDFSSKAVLVFVGLFLALLPYSLVLYLRIYRELATYLTVAAWLVLANRSFNDHGDMIRVLIFLVVAGLSYLVHRKINVRLAFEKRLKVATEKQRACLKLIRPEFPFESDFRPSMPYWLASDRGSRGRYDENGFHLEVEKFAYINCPYTARYKFDVPYQVRVKAQIEKSVPTAELVVSFNEIDPVNFTMVRINGDMGVSLEHRENGTSVVEVPSVTVPSQPEGIIDVEIFQGLHELTVKVNGSVIATAAKVSLPPGSFEIHIGGHIYGKRKTREKAIFCFKSFTLGAYNQ